MDDDNDRLFALMLALIAGGNTLNPLYAAKTLLAAFKKEIQ
jgi:hypothetical protein